MKVLQTITEETNEGFLSLMGKTVTIFCMNYIYTGELIGVNPKIVYETGGFNTKDWKDAQSLPNDLYIRLSAIESYGIVK